jgi:hypothetical protein
MRRKLIYIVPAAIVGFALFVAIGGGIVMWLWNWLTPALFGWRAITFWQAVALLALCRILFGRSGLGRGGRRSRPWRRTPGGWKRMTPEEREEIRRWILDRTFPSGSPEAKPNP